MATIVDGTAGITTPIDVEIQGATSGSIILAAPAVAGSNTQTLVAATETLAPIISGVAVASTSGTSIDFLNIPPWVKRISVLFSNFSTNGVSPVLVQLGTASAGVSNTGYLGAVNGMIGAITVTNQTAGFGTDNTTLATWIRQGIMTITLLNKSTNNWISQSIQVTSNTPAMLLAAGAKTLPDTLDRLRITTVNTIDVFDSGTINILWE